MSINKEDDDLQNERIKVLLIEDNYDYAQLVKRKLQNSKRAKFEVEWADCLSKGLQQLKLNPIDLMLLDLSLPDSQEIDTLIRIQKHAPDIPVIIITATDDEAIAMKSIQMGARAYLIKSEMKSVNLARSILHAYHRFKFDSNQRDKAPDVGRVDLFRNVLDGNADGIVIINKEGYVQYVNTAAEILFGRNEEEMMGTNFGFPLATGKKTEVNIMHKSGVHIVMEMHVVQIEWHGETAYLASLRDVTERKKKEEKLYNLSITDDLTGLYNRRGFFSLAERHISTLNESHKGFLILFIDLDGLKEINDTLGHLIGSQALVDTGEILKETFRDSDIIARFGGDEFVILAKDTSENGADLIKRRMQKNIDSFQRNETRPYALSMSIGAAHYDPSKPATLENLVSIADELMYEDKQNKKTRSSKISF
ncbi:MAG: diguanylate cyclase [Deltaproteobacteria bacterium]